jgi:hypothetical protein
MMQDIGSPEMCIITFKSARYHRSVDHNPHFHRRENINSQTFIMFEKENTKNKYAVLDTKYISLTLVNMDCL